MNTVCTFVELTKIKREKGKKRTFSRKNKLYVPELSEIWGGQERDEDR